MPRQLIVTLKLIITLLVPIVVIGGAANLLASDAYLAFEYGKSGFPTDPYGFTQRQRFVLASTNIHYVRAHLPSNELAKQTMYGAPVYTPREISHMADVKEVFQWVFRIWRASLILLLLLGFILWRSRERVALAAAIQSGGLLTSGLILSVALLALFAWQTWFENFHLIFFKPGSWLFSYSDTLIRLFPLRFWVDATFTISTISLIGGLLLASIGWRWKRLQRSYS